MTAKEYLSRLRSIELRLMAEANEIEALSDMATHITSAINSDGIHTTGATSDKLGNCVSRLVDLQRDIDSDVLMLEKVRGEIIASLDNVPNDKYRELLRMRYVGHMTFEEIAIAMDMSWRWTVKLHGRALQEFSEKNKKVLESS
jgi:DNA-directed RNA polymerase specialized sigma24 family protein